MAWGLRGHKESGAQARRMEALEAKLKPKNEVLAEPGDEQTEGWLNLILNHK